MKQKPSIQFYPQDFLSSLDVQLMTAEEVGVYCLMLFNCAVNGGVLPDNAEALGRLCRGIKPSEIVLKKFYEAGGFLRNKRIDEELEKKQKFSDDMKKAAQLRWSKPFDDAIPKHSKGNAEAMPTQCSSSSFSSSSSNNNSSNEELSSNKSEKVFENNSNEYQLSKTLYDLICENHPKFKEPSFQKWAGEIDKMIRLDSRTVEEIDFIIRWCQKDTFWKRNILSTKKLRDKFDQLFINAKSQYEKYKADEEKSIVPHFDNPYTQTYERQTA